MSSYGYVIGVILQAKLPPLSWDQLHLLVRDYEDWACELPAFPLGKGERESPAIELSLEFLAILPGHL